MMSIFQKVKSCRGFTLLELVISIVVAGAIFGLSADIMMREADTFSYIANRKTTIADARYAFNRINHDLLRIETDDILDISATKIDFIDNKGQNTTYQLATDGSDLALYRGSEVLIPKIEQFNLEYQDGMGNVLSAEPDQIVNVRRIKVTVVTEPVGNEGSITLSTTVIPRSFVSYSNYQ